MTEAAPQLEDPKKKAHMAQLAAARQKAQQVRQENKRKREQRLKNLEERVYRDLQEQGDSFPKVVVKKPRSRSRSPPKNSSSSWGSMMPELVKTAAAGGLSILSLYVANKMKNGAAPDVPKVPAVAPASSSSSSSSSSSASSALAKPSSAGAPAAPAPVPVPPSPAMPFYSPPPVVVKGFLP